jgi:hypothetical protein
MRLPKEGGHKNFGDHVNYVTGHFIGVKLSLPFPARPWRDYAHGPFARDYIIKRVIELGWKPGLFGPEERWYPDSRPKLESVLRKYQRIALHEIVAILSDHYHPNRSWFEGESRFLGAWQTPCRDFDPSFSPSHETDQGDGLGERSFWAGYEGDVDNSDYTDSEWLFSSELNDPKSLVRFTDHGGETWLTLSSFYTRYEKPKFLSDSNRMTGRNSWVHVRSWIVPNVDADSFVRNLRTKHLHGNGVEVVKSYDGWIGEYPWATVYKEIDEICAGDWSRWLKGETTYVTETACSISRIQLLVPCPQLFTLMGLVAWLPEPLRYLNSSEEIAVQSVRTGIDRSEALLVREDLLQDALKKYKISLVWTVIGERALFTGRDDFPGAREFTAVYRLSGEQIDGSITKIEIEPPFKRGEPRFDRISK